MKSSKTDKYFDLETTENLLKKCNFDLKPVIVAYDSQTFN